MSNLSLLILIMSFSLLYLFFINSLKEDNFSKDLLFSLLIGTILIFSLSIFYFYFEDLKLSLILNFLLIINNLLILREIKLINDRYVLSSIPYVLYFIYTFFYILLKLI